MSLGTHSLTKRLEDQEIRLKAVVVSLLVAQDPLN